MGVCGLWWASKLFFAHGLQLAKTAPAANAAVFSATQGMDQLFVCKHLRRAHNVVAENRERIAFKMAKGPHG